MSEQKIFTAICGIIGEIGAIGKNKVNAQQNFKYRGVDDVMNALQPMLAKYKVFVVPTVLEQVREDKQTKAGNASYLSIFKIKYTFYAEDGSFVEAVTIGESIDTGDKGSNKAMAIAFKYALFQVFCIPTEEMPDPDATTPEPHKPTGDKPATTPATKPQDKPQVTDTITDDQYARLNALCDTDEMKATLKRIYSGKGYAKAKEIKQSDYIAILNELEGTGLPFDI